MNTRIPALAAAALSISAMLISPFASAHDRGWRHEEYRPRRERIVERTVVVRERPRVMYEPVYAREAPVYLRERPVIYHRDPSVVISVGLPPLVFPIR